MPNATIGSLPLWLVHFDASGKLKNRTALQTLVTEAAQKQLTDLFVFSHGWNNDEKTARKLYDAFFGEVSALLGSRTIQKKRTARVGVLGVIWPSILWPDSEPNGAGGAASTGKPRPTSHAALARELKKMFSSPEQKKRVDDLVKLLSQRKKSNAALIAFRDKLDGLVGDDSTPGRARRKPAKGAKKSGGAASLSLRGKARGAERLPDTVERHATKLSDAEWRALLEQVADAERDLQGGGNGGGAAGFGDVFEKLWDGAKNVLRTTTYWEMKRRAGVVGQVGLGPLLERVAGDGGGLRVHLLGHSFGARVVSFALAGMSARATGTRSPIKSMFLLQGAFSHFTFAPKLPFDSGRKGELSGMARRVDGPLLTTHSRKDTAVSVAYPVASFLARQDASASAESDFRWGAMGADGAQAVMAQSTELARAGTAYAFQKGKWLNLDGNRIIVRGDPPSGAHSDIIHPHTAWAALAAADLV
jgi:hypothetical protein